MKFSKRKKNTLFIGAFKEPKDGTGGGQLHACRTLLESDIKHELNFVTIDSTMETLPPPGIIRRSFLSFKRMAKFFLSLLQFKFDSILVFTSAGLSFIEKGLMIAIAKSLGLKTVLSPRSGLLIDDLEKCSIFLRYLRFVFSRSDVVICQSNSWKKYYQELTNLDESKFVVIKNWINTEQYLDIPIERKQTDKINVLYMGWIERNKGIYELIEAVSQNKGLQQEFTFSICGQGSATDEAKDLVFQKDISHCFEFKGWVMGKKKINILKSADILILPSYREGLPNSLLEGMASGCAVIASSVGAIPEVIEHQQNGVLLDSPESSYIRDSILYFSSQENRYKCGIKARQTILNNHDIKYKWRSIYQILSS